MKRNFKVIMGLTVVAVLGLGTLAFAGWGRGYGHMMGPDGHHRSGYGQGQEEFYGNLSNEEKTKLDQQRAEFFKATEDTRQQLYEKGLALQSELAKETPDTGKASSLQGEISKLQGDLDQKRLDYEIQARKTSPNYNRGSRGRGYGHMRGYGRGGGNCMW